MSPGNGRSVPGVEGRSKVVRRRANLKARAERKLQLIYSNSHPGERGKTLLEKMEDRLIQTLQERVELKRVWDLSPEDDDKAWENVVENAGKIRGMLEMIAILRSSSVKAELQRAKARLKKED